MDKDAARKAVRRAVDAIGRGEFAGRAGVDPGTLGDFLEGKRWPQGPTRAKIERALGWPEGRIRDLAEAVEAAPDLFAAIDAEPRLVPAAKAHLKNQIELLLQIQGSTPQFMESQQEQRRRDAEAFYEDQVSLADLPDDVPVPEPDSPTPIGQASGKRRRGDLP